MEQIRYLKQQEKQNTRAMYEAIFSEDSKEFVNYYYQWKTKENQILVLEDDKGYEVMMHLNPYEVQINGKDAVIPYIVAVATRPDCRRQGKMQQVMKNALQDMQASRCPFTFLLPANPAYYSGQGFVFGGANQKKSKKLEKSEKQQEHFAEWKYVSLKSNDYTKIQQAAETANRILSEQYDVYVKRNAAYYERLLEETASEQGAVLLIEKEEKCIGILAYGKEEQADVKEFLLFEKYQSYHIDICNQIFGKENWNEEEMRMMFRITDLQSLNGMLKGEQEVLTVKVADDIIAENNSTWRIEWNPEGGNVTRLQAIEATPEATVQQLDVAEVTEKIMEKMSIFIREWV